MILATVTTRLYVFSLQWPTDPAVLPRTCQARSTSQKRFNSKEFTYDKDFITFISSPCFPPYWCTERYYWIIHTCQKYKCALAQDSFNSTYCIFLFRTFWKGFDRFVLYGAFAAVRCWFMSSKWANQEHLIFLCLRPLMKCILNAKWHADASSFSG